MFTRITIKIAILQLMCILFYPRIVISQNNTNFDFSLGVDYSAAEQTLDFFERRTIDTQRITKLRGNQLAAATSIMLARTEKSDDDFTRQLELARDIPRFESDVYGFSTARKKIPELRKLIQEIKRRKMDRRIVSTIASYFPEKAKIATHFSVYLVVMGNERASAFVRNVVWNYDVPIFVSDDKGEPVIVVNLARIVERSNDIETQFIETLSTTAHESFHAAFSVLQKSLPDITKPKNVAEQLLGLVQNEGVAYYISLQTYLGGQTPSREWFNTTTRSIETLNKVLIELYSPRTTYSRTRELIMNANLSGSFEDNYGATAGLRMAYEIDAKLGLPALTETLLSGGRLFFSTYQQACLLDGSIPPFDKRVVQLMKLE